MRCLSLALFVAVASAADRDDFVDAANGAWKFTGNYESYAAGLLKTDWWAYWSGTSGNVLTAYVTTADVSAVSSSVRSCMYMNGIHDCYGLYSIEHIVPKSWTRDAISDTSLQYGAETNAFNWVPSLRYLNSRRSNNRFDTENDDIHEEIVVSESGGEVKTTAEFDEEGEFIVPSGDRGEIARAVLYMIAVYDLDTLGVFSTAEVSAFRSWSLSDPPATWEKSYNTWVLSEYKVSNPLLTSPGVWEKEDDVW